MRVIDANIQTYSDAVESHLERLTGTVNQKLRFDISQLINGLEHDGIWDKIDLLCVVHISEADSLLNLRGVASAPDSTKNNSPVFTSNRGFTTESSGSKFIELGVAEDSWNQYAQNDGHYFCYMRTFNEATTGSAMSLAKSDTNITLSQDTPDELQLTAQGGSGTETITIAQEAPIGFIGISQYDASNMFGRLNDTADSISEPGGTLGSSDTGKVGAEADGGSRVDEQFAAWGVGAGLTAAELAAYENHIRKYMIARGADVY